LFNIHSSKKIYHANQIENIFNEQVANSLPYVVRTTQNNGVRGYIIDVEKFANEENTLSFAQDTFSVFYQKQKYFTGNKVKVLKAKFKNNSEKIMQYLTASFQKSLSKSSWGLGSTIETIKNTKIQLPITPQGKIDFKFMENFIEELEAYHIEELEAYLVATGLKDYNLNKDEKEALAKFDNLSNLSNLANYEMGGGFKLFKLGELFDINNTLSFNKEKLTFGNEYDYITRTSLNQGILQTTGFVNKENINPPNTWSLGLLQMDFFYRKKPWYAGQFVRKVTPKIELNQNSILYFSTLLNKQKQNLLSVLVRDVDKVFLNSKISLPTKNGQIDFSFMESFITAISKLVIKDVVLYANAKIQATRKAINN